MNQKKNPEKCNECKGFHDVPQCVDVCPVEAVDHLD